MKSHAAVRRVFSLGLIFMITALALAHPRAAQAGAPIIVNTWQDASVTDKSVCSLRMAVIAANENRPVGGCIAGTAGHDLILLPPDFYVNNQRKSFEVTGAPNEDFARSGDLDIREPVTISGAGVSKTRVAAPDGANLDRIFHIINLRSGVATLTDMTITNGSSAQFGGGILSDASTLVLMRVIVTGNNALWGGGGIRNQIVDTTTGGIVGGTVKIYDSEITVNTSAGGRGGGISNDGNLEIYTSLIANNTAKLGGGLDNKADTGYSALIVNSTFTQNTANSPLQQGFGMAIYNAGNLEIRSSTIHNNVATDINLEGIFIKFGTTVKFFNTIISGHQPRSNCEIESGAVIISNGHNIDQDGSCGLTVSDLKVDPKLGGLDKWGGKTPVYALQDDSPAIDTGDDASCPPTDQRGMAGLRPGGAHCDIGAFEKDPPPPSQLMLPVIRN